MALVDTQICELYMSDVTTRQRYKYILIVAVAVIGACMFYVDPTDNMDFNRFQSIMNSIRDSQIGFFDYMVNSNDETRWVNATLPYCYSFKLLLYIVSNVTPNNYVIVWISVFIDYSIIAYIAYDFGDGSKYGISEVIVASLLCFSLLPFLHACSGMRMALSSCVMSLAVYRFLYQGKGLIGFAILSLISATIHPLMLIAIPFALVVKVSNNKFILLIPIAVVFFIPVLVMLFSNSDIAILQALSTKYGTYTSDRQFTAYRFAYYGVIIVFALFLIYYVIASWNYHNGNCQINPRKDKLYLFAACYMIIVLGNFGSYEMIARGGYLIGALSPVVTLLLFRNEYGVHSHVAFIIRLAIAVVAGAMCFFNILHYHTYFLPL